ncbi:MAG: sporulation integral membrane protein YlbJ [Clostridia bacterium]|nr:sporulation integral membrane protein YlbJ [Clostridia bacterium]
MNIYLFVVVSLILAVFLSKTKKSRMIYARKLSFPILCAVFILCLIIFSDTAVKSALKGINLWLYVVFPSLFPFFVGSELLNKSGFVKAMGILLEPVMRPLFNVPGCGSFTLAMGITSGYPVGARITAGMREEKLLTRAEAERLLAFTNNSGPLFIIGAVAVGMYNNVRIGVLLLACHIIACLTVGILFRFYKKGIDNNCCKRRGSIFRRFKNELLNNNKLTFSDLGSVFGDAIRNSMSIMLNIGGFIIFFSVLISLLSEAGMINWVSNLLHEPLKYAGISKELINAAISGIFEITTGTNTASKTTGVPYIQQLTVTSMIIGWAGFSVHSQVISIVSNTDIGIKPYLLGKFIQSMFAGVYTFLAIKISGNLFIGSEPVFSPLRSRISLNWNYYLMNSCKYFFIFMSVIAAFTAFSFLINHLLARYRRVHR